MRRTFDSKRRAVVLLAVLGLVMGLFVVTAVPAGAAMKGVVITTGPVYADKCSPCHANIGTVIIPHKLVFKHAFHILVECSACHTDFPHKPDVTSKPKMKVCWACHKLTHGAGGEIARGNCSACHPPEFKMVDPFRKSVANWSGKGHAKLGKLLQKSDCAMCHPIRATSNGLPLPARDQFCSGCHIANRVKTRPVSTYDYDEGTNCLVCHQVTTLSKNAAGNKRASFFVRKNVLVNSVHGTSSCQGCHSDFNFAGRGTSASFQFIASLACEKCHAKQAEVYKKSLHGQLAHKGRQTSVATCGACHGGHDIYKLDAEGKARLSRDAKGVCGGCHANRYRSYDDYYHGAAYKTGAPDAPNCWTCHGAHDILPAKYAASKVSSVNLARTCSACKPHNNAREDFTSYAKLIHRSKEIKSSTFIAQIIALIKSWLP